MKLRTAVVAIEGNEIIGTKECTNVPEGTKKLDEVVRHLNPPDTENIIVNKSALMSYIDSVPCSHCCSKTEYRIREEKLGLSTSIEKICLDCEKRNNTYSSSYEKKSDHIIRSMCANDFSYSNRSSKRIKKSIRNHNIVGQYGRNKDGSLVNLNKTKKGMLHWDSTTVNAVISTLSEGISAQSAQNLYAGVGINSANRFQRIFYNLQPFVGGRIVDVSRELMLQNFMAEIEATIKAEMLLGDSEEDRKKLDYEMQLWRNNDPRRRPVSISVSVGIQQLNSDVN